MVIQRQIILLRSGGLHQQWAHQHRYGPQTRWWKGPHQRPQNGPQSASTAIVPTESGLGPIMNQPGGPLAGAPK